VLPGQVKGVAALVNSLLELFDVLLTLNRQVLLSYDHKMNSSPILVVQTFTSHEREKGQVFDQHFFENTLGVSIQYVVLRRAPLLLQRGTVFLFSLGR